jgi:hypothetical protein
MSAMKPTWLYKLVVVDELIQIQQELLEIFNKHYSNSFNGRGFTFTNIDQDILRTEAPSYIKFLKHIKLYDRWRSSWISGTIGDLRIKDSPLHVDSLDWESRCYALNIPILNCDESHTVWYDAKDCAEEHYSGEVEGIKTVEIYKPETSIEIGRLVASNPAWVNVSIPHRAENNNSELRLLCTTRFYPELHDYFSN